MATLQKKAEQKEEEEKMNLISYMQKKKSKNHQILAIR